MLPGGEDIVIDDEVDRWSLLSALFDAWEDAVMERAAPNEYMIYKSVEWMQCWSERGYVPANADTMIHVLFGLLTTTCVVYGPESRVIVQEAVRHVRSEAP